MRRRKFIGVIALAAVARPCATSGQPVRKLPVVGVMITTSLTTGASAQTIAALRDGLRQSGYVEGQNIVLDIRSAGGKPEALAGIALDLVRLDTTVLCAFGPVAVRAAIAATRTIPIVALDLETDPVEAGWAQSLARPGGNITGLFLNLSVLTGKWLELLRTAMPAIRDVAVLWDNTTGGAQPAALRTNARALGIELRLVELRTTDEVPAGLRAAMSSGAKAMVMLSSPIVRNSSKQIAQFAIDNRLPAISPFRPFAEFGGLMSYGPDLEDFFRRCATYVDRILKGAKPGELPIEQPLKFELVVNLKAAKALGLAIPQSLLLRADDVLE